MLLPIYLHDRHREELIKMFDFHPDTKDLPGSIRAELKRMKHPVPMQVALAEFFMDKLREDD